MDLKRTVSISCLAGATLLLLAFMIFPHHHHYGGWVCYVMERCEQDGDINDEHTCHHANDSNHHDCCIAEIHYIVPSTYNDIKCKVFSCNDNHCLIHLFPVLCFPMDSNICSIDLFAVKYGFGEVVSFYKFTDVSQNHGLRAPPFFLLS
ncbi:hypothetical protein EZS27_005631 [termite gut metagenome]|uniref:Uncharacterized protein n=1 Tax=termite gut metagenome TaxID=433724 RepID=A0A5J4SLV3_9ZZZZ